MQISQISWVWSKVFSVCSLHLLVSAHLASENETRFRENLKFPMLWKARSKQKQGDPLVASFRSTLERNQEKSRSCAMCSYVFPLPHHESKSFTSCKTSAHVVGLQCPRTESPKQPFGGQMVSTKGVWLICDFPLESKCYQSSVWALQVRACCGYLSLSND